MTEATTTETSNVGLKLLAALVAFAAGIAAVVTVVVLAHETPSAGSASSGPQAAATPTAAPTPPAAAASFPAPPANALALAQEDRDLAVALAVRPRGSSLALQASVVGQESPAEGLTVAFRLPGRPPAPARACGAGCYRADVDAPAPRRVDVAIRGRNRPSSTVSFALPSSLPGPSAAAIVQRADRTWRSLHTLVVHDRLASGPGNAITTLWRFAAPASLSYAIRNGPQAVVIGARRWDRLPGHGWQASQQDPIRQPVPLWEAVSNARVVGMGSLRGRPVWQVAFFDPQIKAWFRIWVDRQTGRTLELRMTAQAHFMHQVYGPFDGLLKIVPPVKADT
jgi:hypothetical protein